MTRGKPIQESLHMAEQINSGRNVSRTEKGLSNGSRRSELHPFLKPGSRAIEQLVRQQVGEHTAHGTCLASRPRHADTFSLQTRSRSERARPGGRRGEWILTLEPRECETPSLGRAAASPAVAEFISE